MNRRQTIIWTIDGLVYWHIYASHGFNDFAGLVVNYGISNTIVLEIP